MEFYISNGGKIILSQTKKDGAVTVKKYYGDDIENEYKINPGDMVMLLNLYQHIKNNDIQNDFINLYGKNKEV